jgi:two-component system, NarL family, nitrate/nitrite response regulator NarL
VLKESATRQLIDGIHRVMEGKFLIGTEVADDLAQAVRQIGAPRDKPYGLTPREIEIVEAIASGDSNRDIANRLDTSAGAAPSMDRGQAAATRTRQPHAAGKDAA